MGAFLQDTSPDTPYAGQRAIVAPVPQWHKSAAGTMVFDDTAPASRADEPLRRVGRHLAERHEPLHADGVSRRFMRFASHMACVSTAALKALPPLHKVTLE